MLVAALPPTLTVTPARRLVPVIVTSVPPAEFPLAGAMALTVGAGYWIVNAPLSVDDCVSGFVMVTTAEPGVPAGVVAVIEVALATTTPVAGTPPRLTVAPDTKPVPVIVIDVPPTDGPSAGDTATTVGAAAASARGASRSSPSPAARIAANVAGSQGRERFCILRTIVGRRGGRYDREERAIRRGESPTLSRTVDPRAYRSALDLRGRARLRRSSIELDHLDHVYEADRQENAMRVAVLDDYQGVALGLADWASLGADVEVQSFADHLGDEADLAARLEPFEVVVAMRERTAFPRSLVERLPNLRLLVTTGARNAAFDMPALRERGITVCGTGSAGSGTSELAWGLILALLRRIHEEDRATRQGQWETTLGIGLQGKTLGVIGLGNLGSRVAAVGKAFGMELLAWSQNLTAERAAACGATLVTQDELLTRSDIVSIHLVLSDRTRGLIGAQELALMKPSAYLVNTSRGPIVDEPALIEALRAGRIAGAGLDTFDIEPLPAGHAFLGMDNVVLTPHLGYVLRETYEVFYGDAVEDIRAFRAGAPVRVVE